MSDEPIIFAEFNTFFNNSGSFFTELKWTALTTFNKSVGE